MDIFERYESEVRSYCRVFPTIFNAADGAFMHDHTGKRYIDFFAGAGALNYGHNDPILKQALSEYLSGNGPIHSLDLHTTAKQKFIENFVTTILDPRHMDYKLMFPGPTGTNAVEAALKLARKITGRTSIAAFTNGFHGMTLGSLAATSNLAKRAGAGLPLSDVIRLPFDGFFGEETDSLSIIEKLFDDPGSGYQRPAAFLTETIQCEGGLHVASTKFLRGLAVLARRLECPLIIDDIQAGCGRTGPFFSFEAADIKPDIICLSKSLSGLGLPLSLVLIKPKLDQWVPGEHNGTFRGNNLAFVTAAAALAYWQDDNLECKVQDDANRLKEQLNLILNEFKELFSATRGCGLAQGLVCRVPEHGSRISRQSFTKGLIIETCGPSDEVVKLLPPLTIDRKTLDHGLDILKAAIGVVADDSKESELYKTA